MSDNLDILVQNLRGERDEYPGEYVREAAEAIDRLRAELAEKEDVIFCFEAELKTANARIAELERISLSNEGIVINRSDVHIITTDQINAAWERVREAADLRRGEVVDELLAMLKPFGIVPCEKCGGTKLNIDDDGDLSHPVNMGECDCPNSGWVMEGV